MSFRQSARLTDAPEPVPSSPHLPSRHTPAALDARLQAGDDVEMLVGDGGHLADVDLQIEQREFDLMWDDGAGFRVAAGLLKGAGIVRRMQLPAAAADGVGQFNQPKYSTSCGASRRAATPATARCRSRRFFAR